MPRKSTDIAPLVMPKSTALAIPSGAQPMTKAENRIWGESHRQQVIIEAQREKAVKGLDAISNVHEHAVDTFAAAIGHSEKVYDEVKDTSFEQYASAYIKHSTESLVHHMDSAIGASGTAIAQQLGKSVVPEPEPVREGKPGLIKRILGDY